MAYVDEENGFYVGNIGNIYELRRVGKDNRSVVDFSLACTPRYRNNNGEWEEGEVVWVNATAWGTIAEHISESLSKGDRVMVKGRKEMKPKYTKDDGTEIPERPFLVVEYAGPELFFNNVKVERRGSRGSSGSPRPSSSNNSSSSNNTTSLKKETSKPEAQAKSVNDDFDLDEFDDLDQPF